MVHPLLDTNQSHCLDGGAKCGKREQCKKDVDGDRDTVPEVISASWRVSCDHLASFWMDGIF